MRGSGPCLMLIGVPEQGHFSLAGPGHGPAQEQPYRVPWYTEYTEYILILGIQRKQVENYNKQNRGIEV